jgi:hypothetical protein
MIKVDRQLLSRLSAVNQSMGEIVLHMISREDGGQLNAADLRAVGRQLTLLGADMVRRADDLDRTGCPALRRPMTLGDTLDTVLRGAGVGALLAIGWQLGGTLLRGWRRWSLDRGRRSWLRDLRRHGRRQRSTRAGRRAV